MSWFLITLACVVSWGCADLFYKTGSEENDRYSHCKIAVWVGLVMGVCAVALLPLSESGLSPARMAGAALAYAPASLSYILSMIIGYAGLRYLDLSIVSPVQNASGAFSAIAVIGYFWFTGRGNAILHALTWPDLIGTGMIVAGMIALAIVQQQLSRSPEADTDRRYRMGAAALAFPLLYCLFDTVGTAADGILLSDTAGLSLGEIDVIILYGLTFFAVGVGCWLFLLLKTGRPYNPFARSERVKGIAAVCEEGGQIFYVYAMAANPVLTAPMAASYCIVSVLLSHWILKERLRRPQTVCVTAVIAGIVLLGIAEGLAEM